MNVATTVRQDKEAHPEKYCAKRECLWKVVTRFGTRPCPKHPTTQASKERVS